MVKQDFTPSNIREIETKREQRRLKKLQSQETVVDANGIPSVTHQGFRTNFIQRRLVPVRDGAMPISSRNAARFTLMTYNILAQSLVRRKLFPTSGESLKWKNRQWVLKVGFPSSVDQG